MDDFSQIIGLVIAAIFFIASAIRKKNKKDAAPNRSNKLTDVLESFLGGDLETNQQPVFNQPEAEEIIYHQEPTENLIPGSQFKKSQSSLVNQEVKFESSFKKPNSNVKSQSKKQHKKQRNFDLKQAVIYSEILKPKKF